MVSRKERKAQKKKTKRETIANKKLCMKELIEEYNLKNSSGWCVIS